MAASAAATPIKRTAARPKSNSKAGSKPTTPLPGASATAKPVPSRSASSKAAALKARAVANASQSAAPCLKVASAKSALARAGKRTSGAGSPQAPAASPTANKRRKGPAKAANGSSRDCEPPGNRRADGAPSAGTLDVKAVVQELMDTCDATLPEVLRALVQHGSRNKAAAALLQKP